MKLSQPINIRLTEQSMRIYQIEAEAKNQPLTTYIRHVLDERLQNNNAAEEIRQLRKMLEYLLPDFQIFNSVNSDEADTDEDKRNIYISNPRPNLNLMSPVLEILFMMRRTAEIQTQNFAQGELERLGYEVWKAGDREKELRELAALKGKHEPRR